MYIFAFLGIFVLIYPQPLLPLLLWVLCAIWAASALLEVAGRTSGGFNVLKSAAYRRELGKVCLIQATSS